MVVVVVLPQVKNVKSMDDSLAKMVVEEDISDFDCATCKRKVPVMKKRTVLGALPPVIVMQVRASEHMCGGRSLKCRVRKQLSECAQPWVF